MRFLFIIEEKAKAREKEVKMCRRYESGMRRFRDLRTENPLKSKSTV